jgi:hypothetical protein
MNRGPVAPVLYDASARRTTAFLATPLADYGFSVEEAQVLRDQLLALLDGMPGWKRARSAFVVRRDGVEVLDRAELAQHYRRHGLRVLAYQVRQASMGRVLLVLEGEPETTVLTVDGDAWLRAMRGTP